MNLLAHLRHWLYPRCARCRVRVTSDRPYCADCLALLPVDLAARWRTVWHRCRSDEGAYRAVRAEVDGWFELERRASWDLRAAS